MTDYTNNKQIHQLTELDGTPSDGYVHVNVDNIDYKQPIFKFANGVVNRDSLNNVVTNYPEVIELNITVGQDMLDEALSGTLSGLEEAQVTIDEELRKLNQEVIPKVDTALNSSLQEIINTVETTSNVFGESFAKIERNSLVLSIDKERKDREAALAELNTRLDDLNQDSLPAVRQDLDELLEDFEALEGSVVTIDSTLSNTTDQILSLNQSYLTLNDNLDEITASVGDSGSGLIKRVDDLTFTLDDPTTGLTAKVTNLEDSVDSVTTDVSANSSAIQTISTLVNDTDKGVIANSNRLDTLNNQITDPAFGLSANATAVQNLTSQVSSLTGQVQAQSGNATTLSVSVDAPLIAEGISDVFGDMENTVTLNAEISRVDKVIADSEGTARAISDLQLTVNDTNNNLATANQSIVALSDQVTGTIASVTELNNRVDIAMGSAVNSQLELSTVQEDLTDIREANAQLSASIENTNDEVSNAVLRLTTTEQNVSDLESESNTLLSRAYLGTDVNGFVSGIDFTNDGSFSQVKIKGDNFMLANSAGVPQLVYTSSGDTFDFLGTVRADKVVVGSGGLSSEVVSAMEINGDQITANTMNADKIVSNSITGEQISADAITSDLVKASVITAKHLVITSQNDAINLNSTFQNLDGWYVNGVQSPETGVEWRVQESNHPNISGYEVAINGTGNDALLYSEDIPIDNRKTYKLSAITYSSSIPNLKLFVRFKDIDGNYISATGQANQWLSSNSQYHYWKYVTNGSGWVTQELVFGNNEYLAGNSDDGFIDETSSYFTIPDNAVSISLGAVSDRDSGDVARIINYYIAGMEDGSFTVQGSITGDKIAAKTISADNIVANTITGDEIKANTITSENIAAGAITARELTISSSVSALSKNPALIDGGGWYVNAAGTSELVSGSSGWIFSKDATSPTGGYLIRNSNSSRLLVSDLIPISRDQVYMVSVRASASGNTGYARFYLTFYDENGTLIVDNSVSGWSSINSYLYSWTKPSGSNSNIIAPDPNQILSTNWERYQGLFGRDSRIPTTDSYPEIPVGATHCRMYMSLNNGSSGGTSYIQEPYLTNMLAGSLTVEGSIRGTEIAAQTITASNIASKTITAEQIASNSITTGQINFLASDIGGVTAQSAQDAADAAQDAAEDYADNNAKAAGSVGGWKLNANSIYSSSTPYTGTGFATTGITLKNTGSIHAEQFALDSDGSAKFGGQLESAGGTYTGSIILDSGAGSPSEDDVLIRLSPNKSSPFDISVYEDGSYRSLLSVTQQDWVDPRTGLTSSGKNNVMVNGVAGDGFIQSSYAIVEEVKKSINPNYLGGGDKVSFPNVTHSSGGSSTVTVNNPDGLPVNGYFKYHGILLAPSNNPPVWTVVVYKNTVSSSNQIYSKTFFGAIFSEVEDEEFPTVEYTSITCEDSFLHEEGVSQYVIKVLRSNGDITQLTQTGQLEIQAFRKNELETSTGSEKFSWIDKDTGYTRKGGSVSVSGNGTKTITFAKPFTSVFNAHVTGSYNNTGGWAIGTVTSLTTTRVIIQNQDNSTRTLYWSVEGVSEVDF